ncbi:MAG: translocation/assembly module TamB domain-containing protein [Deltaproteobacteria bacterium]|jgi:translocation and assembly module TamB|nr:translocation/assembly module TamB domain-containing protein [Deltaproteobacteria bacterium]
MPPEDADTIKLEKNAEPVSAASPKIGFPKIGRPKRAKGKARKALKFTAFFLLGLILVLAAAIVWIRSDSGLNYVAKKGLDSLAKNGLSIQWDRLVGPAPEEITAEKVVFRDRLGPFASADRLEFRLKLGSLFKGLIEVEGLNVTGLNLDRRPEYVPSPDDPDSAGGRLPFDLKARFDVTGHMTHRFLEPQADDSASGALKLSGDFSLIGGSLAAKVNSSWLDDRHLGLELDADLIQGQNSAPDRLKVLLAARDGPGGPLSYLIDRPDWPSWSLVLYGDGPLSGWDGKATLALLGVYPELAPAAAGETAASEAAAGEAAAGEAVAANEPVRLESIASAELTIAGKNGTFKKDLIDGRGLRLTLSAQLGPDAPLPIPDKILDPIGRDLKLKAEVALEGHSLKGDLTLDAPRATVSVSSLDLGFLDRGFSLKGDGRIAFDPTLAADFWPAPDSESAPGGENPPGGQNPPAGPGLDDPQGTPSPTLALQSVPDAPGAIVAASYPLPPPPDQKSRKSPSRPVSGEEWLAFDYALNVASQGGQVDLEALNLKGPGLSAQAAGTVAPDSAKKANLALTLEQGSPLWPMALALIGSGSQKSGSLSLLARLSQDPKGLVDLAAKVSLSELDLLASPWGGPIEADLKARGPLDNLAIELLANSPSLKGPMETFPDVALTYRGQAKGLPAFNGADGTLTLKTGNFPTGPIDLATDFAFSLPPQQSPAASGGDPEGLALDLNLKTLVLSAGPAKELLDLESQGLSLALRPGSAPRPKGSLRLKVGDWKTVRALTGLEFDGAPASLEANLDPGGENGNSALVKLDLPDLTLGQELRLKALTLDLTARDYLTAPTFELRLSAGQSAVGPIALSKANVEGQGDGLKAKLKVELLAANGSELLALTGEADLGQKKATVESLKLASVPQLPGGLRLNQPVTVDFSSGLSLSQTSVTLGGGGTLDLVGSLNPLNVKAKLVDFSFANLSGLTDQAPQGKATLSLDYVQGGSGSFELTSQLAAPPALESLSKTLNVTANGKIEPRSVSGKITLGKTRLRDISLDYRLPLVQDGLFVKPDLDGPLSAEMSWKGPIAPIWTLIGLADRSLTGELELDLKVEGSARKPRPKVNMYVANGQYLDLVLGILVTRINMEVHDQPDGDLRLVLEAGDVGDGKLSLEGTVKPFAAQPSIAVRGQLRRLSPLQRDDATAIITGLVHLDGPFTSLGIAAKVVVEQAKIDLDMVRGGGAITKLDLEEKLTRVSYGPRLALDIDLPRQIFIRGKGLDSEWGGHLDVTNPFGRTLINGALKPIRGTFDLLSKQFNFTGGDIRFMNSPGINPVLNVELTRQTSALQAFVKVTGFVAKPVLTLTSQPPHPSDEVLSQVLFGKKVSQLSRMEAIQLANSVRVMAGLGGDIGLTVLSTMRDALGLSVLKFGDASDNSSNRILGGNQFRDNLNLDSDSQAADSTTLEAGRYIGDNIYVGLEQNLTDNTTGVRVEVELTPSISLQSLSSSSSSRVGLGWKKDY